MKNGERGARVTLTVDVLATAEAARQQRSGRSDSDGRLWTGRRRGRNERYQDRRGEAVQGGSDSGGGAVETAMSGRWRAVPTALLTRWHSVARGVAATS
jgi:hypothetical protein